MLVCDNMIKLHLTHLFQQFNKKKKSQQKVLLVLIRYIKVPINLWDKSVDLVKKIQSNKNDCVNNTPIIIDIL